MVPTRAITAAALGYAVLSLASRRWHRHWGATRDEVTAAMSGDELVPDAGLQTTRAIDIAGRIGRLAELLLLEPGYFVMERGMLRGIRRRAARR